MDMTGERRIAAPREKVWAALNDPDTLKKCIPGCESLEKHGDNDLAATASIKIGPISARFSGRVQLVDLDPPNGYRIQGEGQGGVAGFAKGGATVKLAEDGSDTLLSYAVQAQVGGKIAQLGARLIDATAKSMADQFFNRFTAEMGPVPLAAAAGAESMPIAAAAATGPVNNQVNDQIAAPEVRVNMLDLIPAEPFGLPLVAWIGGGIFLVIFILIFGSYVF